MDKLVLTPNVPEQIALKFKDGKLSEGRYGDQMFYTLVDGRGWYAELDTAAKINLLELRPREPFNVCLRWTGKKNDLRIVDIWRPEQGQVPPAAPPVATMPRPVPMPAAAATGIPETDLERQLRQSLETERAQQPLPPQRLATAPSNGTHVNGAVAPNGNATNGHAANGNGYSNGHAANGNGIIPPVKIRMDRAVVDAVRMVQRAMKETGEQWSDQSRQDYASTILIAARQEGWLCAWTSEDLV